MCSTYVKHVRHLLGITCFTYVNVLILCVKQVCSFYIFNVFIVFYTWTFFLWYVWCRVKKWVNTTNVCFVGLLLGIPRGWSLWFEHHVHLCRCQLNYKNKADKADCSDRFFYHSVIMNVIVTWCCIILLSLH